MATISLCMIVKGEEEYLQHCLDSVKGIVDEIIIVDTGSKDATVKIAEDNGAKVFFFDWNDDFSTARNESIKHATSEWILVLDADETISKKDHLRIKKLLDETEYKGFAFVQRSYMNDSSPLKWVSSKGDSYDESRGYSGWIYSGITRLFRNDQRIRFEYPVHETVMNSIEKIGGKIMKTDIPIHHYGKIRGKEYVEQKGKLYLELGKKKLEVLPEAKSFFELAVQAQTLRSYDVAINNFKKAIELNSEWAACYVNLGGLYIKKGMLADAVQSLETAIKLNPDYSSAYSNLGIAYEQAGNIEKAVSSYQKAIELDGNNAESYFNLSRVFFNSKQIGDAVKTLKKALEVNPSNILIYINLGGLYLQEGRSDNAVNILKKAVEIEPDNTEVLINLGMVLASRNNNEEAVKFLEKAVSLNPKNKEELQKIISQLKS